MGFAGIAIFNTDNACASSSSGLMQAYAAVRAGLYEVALVLGAEKMNYPHKRQEMFEAFKGSWDRDLADRHMQQLLAMGAGLALPPEAANANYAAERSVFMDIYAAQAHFHMKTFGATGTIQIHELVMQLRGEAGPRQVEGARIGLAENGGGFYGLEEAACVVTILEK